MSNVSLKQSDLGKIKWVQTNYLTAPGKCLDLLHGIESNDPFIAANKHNLVGVVQYFKSEYYNALEHCNKAITICQQHKFPEIETKALINKSGIYIRIKRYNLALECAFESLKHKFDRLNSMSYNNLSMVYGQLGNHEKQLEFQNKAKSLNEKVGEKRLVVLDLFNIGEFYSNQRKFEKALTCYKESLEIIKKHKLNMFLAYAHSQIANVYYEKKNYKQALQNSNKAIEYTKQFETDDFVYTSFVKAKILYHYKQYNEAMELLDGALDRNEVEQDYKEIFELKIEIESEHKPEKLVATYRDYVNLLKSESNNLDGKNDLTNILKFKEKEIEEIQKRNEAIEQQNRELEVVSKLLAHDLKTPIRTIGSFVNLIKNKSNLKSDPEINEYIEFVSNGTQEIYKKMDDTEKYLNFKLSKNKTQFKLDAVLDHLIFNLENNIKIIADKDLPTIYGDKIAIRRMFKHLFQFIIKQSKKEQIEIQIRHETDGKEDLFFITDNENTLQFTRYWFEDNFHAEFIKTGKVDIGFAFVRKIVKLHNGHLLIDEGPNAEPLLKIWLPQKIDN